MIQPSKLLWRRIGIIIPNLILSIYLYFIVVSRTTFTKAEFIVFIVLGLVAQALLIKALLQSRSDLKDNVSIHSKPHDEKQKIV